MNDTDNIVLKQLKQDKHHILAIKLQFLINYILLQHINRFPVVQIARLIKKW